MHSRIAGAAVGVGLAAAVTAALAIAAPHATAETADHDLSAPDLSGSELAAPGLTEAWQRDLGLSPAAAQTRLEREEAAGRTARQLRGELGSGYGGAWLGDDGRLTVGVTDPSRADEVRAAGAEPAVVTRSQQELRSLVGRLDAADPPSAGVTSWYVDIPSNRVVVAAVPSAVTEATDFLAAAGVPAAAVTVVETADRPVPLADVQGGDAYFINRAIRCSIGFAVVGGFVTAGHCGEVGATTTGFDDTEQGTVQGSSFPGVDHGWVEVNDDWTPQPWVNDYQEGTVLVAGAEEAPIGATVCRSGSTTGWRCGEIEAIDVAVNYAQGTVFGMVQSTACAEGGDSGGAWLWGDQAQGITSGGSGNCTLGGTSFYQPLLPVLAEYDLTLVTAEPVPGA